VKRPETGCLFVLGNAHGKLPHDQIFTMLLPRPNASSADFAAARIRGIY
jgi:hypothetical protein